MHSISVTVLTRAYAYFSTQVSILTDDGLAADCYLVLAVSVGECQKTVKSDGASVDGQERHTVQRKEWMWLELQQRKCLLEAQRRNSYVRGGDH